MILDRRNALCSISMVAILIPGPVCDGRSICMTGILTRIHQYSKGDQISLGLVAFDTSIRRYSIEYMQT